MSAHPHTESTEMYLKALAELSGGQAVATGRLAERLGITQVSANERVKRLADQGLVNHQPFKGIVLTDTGRAVAHDVIRRQRLWECFLHDHLGVAWQDIYEYACDLEHATAPAVTAALADFLGHPSRCPHGDPIPDAAGVIDRVAGVPLSTLGVGQGGQVLAVQATSTEVFAYLAQRGLLPGRTVRVLEVAPLQGPLTVQVDGASVALGLLLAELIVVQPGPK